MTIKDDIRKDIEGSNTKGLQGNSKPGFDYALIILSRSTRNRRYFEVYSKTHPTCDESDLMRQI